MAIESIKMPDIGEGIAEVELVAWRVAVGDTVHEDQSVADVMTDKATVEIPSHVSGRVLALSAQPGQVVAVGTPIISIEVAPSPAPALAQNQPVTPVQTAQAAPENRATQRPAACPTPPASGPADAAAPPAQVPAPDAAGVAEPARAQVLAAPAVRARAQALGVDLAQVAASGPHGQVTHADLDAYRSAALTRGQPEVQNSSQIDSALRTSDGRYSPIQATDDEVRDVLPVIGLRRKIAEKMQAAKRQIPHFSYVEEIDVTALEALREQLNARYAATRGRLTLLPFLVRALVAAIAEHPQINARYDDAAGQLTRYRALHLGLATQTPGGLMVPVIRHAERLDLWQCAAAIRTSAEAARSGRASRAQLSGSTLTVTSLGPLAGIAHTPVINAPEVAIVGPNRIVERLVPVQGTAQVRQMMNLSSSFDHRVVDGMDAAEFIQSVRLRLQSPALLWAEHAA